VQRGVNGTRADVQRVSTTSSRPDGHPMNRSPSSRSGHRRLPQLRVNREIPPFTRRPDDGRRADPAAGHRSPVRVSQMHRVLLCQDVCHILRSTILGSVLLDRDFFVRVASLEMHPKDVSIAANRRASRGLGYCNITKCCPRCARAHPLPITDIPLKERVADVHWDPVRFVGRKLFGRSGD